MLQVLMPERAGEKPQLPSHASLKGNARKYTLDACLDGSVSQVSLAEQIQMLLQMYHVHALLYNLQILQHNTIVHWFCRKMWQRSAMWRTWLTGHCKASL